MKQIKKFVLVLFVLTIATAAFLPALAENEEKAAAINEAKASFSDLYEAINPSVVYIAVAKPQSVIDEESYGNGYEFNFEDLFGPEFKEFFRDYQNENEAPKKEEKPEEDIEVYYGAGTGFVWDEEGHIVTNQHVIDGATKITVTYSDGIERDARLVGQDPDSDLAVIYVENFREDIPPVVMGDSTALKTGDLTATIGNPLGQNGTMTQGIISALGRSFSVSNGDENGKYSIPDMIQTDAAINHGNSGGVLINLDGEVIGVVNSFSSYSNSSAGIGYAIPSALVKRVIPALIENGKYEHPWIGISGIALTPDINEVLGLEHDQRGALVQTIQPNSPALDAGILAGDTDATVITSKIRIGGDVIVRIEDHEVKAMDDIIAYLSSNTSVGDTINLTVLRDGEEVDVPLMLSARPTAADSAALAKTDEEQTAGNAYLGAYVMELSDEVLNLMELPAETTGVLVTDVMTDSPAEIWGLQGCDQSETVNGKNYEFGGDIITALNDAAVDSVSGLKAEIAKCMPGEVVKMTIIRDGEEQDIRLILGNTLSK